MLKTLTQIFFIVLLPLTLNATSLWLKSSNNQRGMFGGKRAFSVGDLLTIDVAESSSLAASQNSVRNRQLQVENAVTQFLYANSKLGTHNGGCPVHRLKRKVAIKEVVQLPIPKTSKVG